MKTNRKTTGLDSSLNETDTGTIFGNELKRQQAQGLKWGPDMFQERYVILINSRTSMGLGSIPVPVGIVMLHA